jgi:hypothetical protein
VVDCVYNIGSSSRDGNLADAPDAQRVQVRVRDANCGNINLANVSIHRHAVVCKICVHDPAIMWINLRIFSGGRPGTSAATWVMTVYSPAETGATLLGLD